MCPNSVCRQTDVFTGTLKAGAKVANVLLGEVHQQHHLFKAHRKAIQQQRASATKMNPFGPEPKMSPLITTQHHMRHSVRGTVKVTSADAAVAPSVPHDDVSSSTLCCQPPYRQLPLARLSFCRQQQGTCCICNGCISSSKHVCKHAHGEMQGNKSAP